MKPEELEGLFAHNAACTQAGAQAASLRFMEDHGPEILSALRRVEKLEAALMSIVQWADAYPLDIFPEPDFPKAAEALRGAGITLDAVSASNMRHATKRVGQIARQALTGEA